MKKALGLLCLIIIALIEVTTVVKCNAYYDLDEMDFLINETDYSEWYTSLKVDQTLDLSVELCDESEYYLREVGITNFQYDVDWYSDDEDIASISHDGKVTGKKVGTTSVHCQIIVDSDTITELDYEFEITPRDVSYSSIKKSLKSKGKEKTWHFKELKKGKKFILYSDGYEWTLSDKKDYSYEIIHMNPMIYVDKKGKTTNIKYVMNYASCIAGLYRDNRCYDCLEFNSSSKSVMFLGNLKSKIKKGKNGIYTNTNYGEFTISSKRKPGVSDLKKFKQICKKGRFKVSEDVYDGAWFKSGKWGKMPRFKNATSYYMKCLKKYGIY